MPKIVNERYKSFMQEGAIDPIKERELEPLLEKIDYKDKPQARALTIITYYSGRRPVEILDLMPQHIAREVKRTGKTFKKYVTARFHTAKGGKESILYFPANPHIEEFFKYAKSFPPSFYVFHGFRSPYRQIVKSKANKKVLIREQSGELTEHKEQVITSKEYLQANGVMKYYFNKWFKLPPYFFRHNRLSLLAERGATDRQLLQAKGAKDYKSIQAYIHLSRKEALAIADIQEENKENT